MMNDKLGVIDQKIDCIVKMLGDLTGMVKALTPAEAKKYSDDLRKQVEAAEEKMRLMMNLVRRVTGNEGPQQAYDVHEAAFRLGLAAFTVRQKCNLGKIKAKKVKGAGEKGEWRIRGDELERYERDGDLNPPEPPAKD